MWFLLRLRSFCEAAQRLLGDAPIKALTEKTIANGCSEAMVATAGMRAQRSTGADLNMTKNRVVDEAFGEIDIRLVRMAATGRQMQRNDCWSGGRLGTVYRGTPDEQLIERLTG
jgi:hypothetical protein